MFFHLSLSQLSCLLATNYLIGFRHFGNEENHEKRYIFILHIKSLKLVMKEHNIFSQFRKKIRKQSFKKRAYYEKAIRAVVLNQVQDDWLH